MRFGIKSDPLYKRFSGKWSVFRGYQ